MIATISAQQASIDDQKIRKLLDGEKVLMQKIVELPDNENKTRQQMGADMANIGLNLTHTITAVASLPTRTSIEAYLQ